VPVLMAGGVKSKALIKGCALPTPGKRCQNRGKYKRPRSLGFSSDLSSLAHARPPGAATCCAEARQVPGTSGCSYEPALCRLSKERRQSPKKRRQILAAPAGLPELNDAVPAFVFCPSERTEPPAVLMEVHSGRTCCDDADRRATDALHAYRVAAQLAGKPG